MRTITSEAQAVFEGPVVPMALLVRLGFSSPVRLCTGAVAIQVGAELYYGAGSLGTVEAIRDEPSGTRGLSFSFSGVPTDNIALALQEQARGKACTVTLVVLDPTTHEVVDTPVTWSGVIDQMPISYSAGGCTIGVNAVHKGELMRRPKPLRYTDGDQQRLFTGDTSLRFVVAQSQKQDVWPAAGFFKR